MKKIIIILIFLLLNNCGFTPLYSSKNSNYNVISIEKNISNNLTKYMQDRISVLSNKNSEKKFKINFSLTEDIIVILKDSKGNPEKNRLTMTVDLSLFSEDQSLISLKEFSESFEYAIQDNKFNLRQYEKNIKFNLVEDITQQILVFLASV